MHHELRKPHVTLALLWQEYRRVHPEDGYEYSRFCELYADWRDTRCNPIMRQHHRLGEKAFVDFAGSTIPIVCRLTGLISPAQLFVAVLGGSNLTFIEPVPAQDLLSWLRAHVAMFDYFGGCPEVVVPDNLKAGVDQSLFLRPRPSIRPIRLWPTTTAWPSCPPGRGSPGIRRRRSRAFSWPRDGSWPS